MTLSFVFLLKLTKKALTVFFTNIYLKERSLSVGVPKALFPLCAHIFLLPFDQKTNSELLRMLPNVALFKNRFLILVDAR